MKKKSLIITILIVLLLALLSIPLCINIFNNNDSNQKNKQLDNNNSQTNISKDETNDNKSTEKQTSKDEPKESNKTETIRPNKYVSYNGWLKTNGNQLQNSKGEPIQLHGISSHGIEWFSDLITYDNLKTLKDDWNINIFRIAMYTDANGTGYTFSPDTNLSKVYNIVDMATDLDMYVIIDWHILNDNNPQQHQDKAKEFFETVSKKYANTPNVIYEICNEPNGNDVTWEYNIKPYAQEIIPIIRNNSPKSLIIVGTPRWCQDIDIVAESPLNYENIIYSCHFYAGTHREDIRNKVQKCLEKNLPVFISECGITAANGDGEIYPDEFKTWIDYLDRNNISWLFWSLSNKQESSSILIPGQTTLSSKANNSENSLNDNSAQVTEDSTLTNTGKIIKEILNNY